VIIIEVNVKVSETFAIFTNVKSLSIIFAVIFTVLSCIPCADGAVHPENSSNIAQNSNDSQKSNQHSDACSPFCVCSCCQGIGFFKLAEFIPSENFVSAIVEKQLPQYTSTLFSSFQNSIWQPPKIS